MWRYEKMAQNSVRVQKQNMMDVCIMPLYKDCIHTERNKQRYWHNDDNTLDDLHSYEDDVQI